MAGLDLLQTRSRANALLERWELQNKRQVDIVAAFDAVDIRMSARSPRGCEGYTTFNLNGYPDVHLSQVGDERAVQRRAMHEAGHVGQCMRGDRWPHHEPSTHRLGLMVAMPELGMKDALREACGTDGGAPDPRVLQELYPLQYLPDIMERVALHHAGWCYQFTLKKGLEVANDHVSPLAAEFLAYEVRNELLRTGRLIVRLEDGRVGTHYETPERRGWVVVVPPSAVEERRRRLLGWR